MSAFRKIYSTSLCAAVLFLICEVAEAEQPVALIGGVDGTAAYAAFVDPLTNTAGPPIANLPTQAGTKIKSVALNHVGLGCIGGVSTFPTTTPYAAFVNQSTNTVGPIVTNLAPIGNNHFINSVQINDLGQGIVGGFQNPANYAAFINFDTNSAGPPLTFSSASGASTQGVAINDAGHAILTTNAFPVFTAFADPQTNTVGPLISNLPSESGSHVYGVAINNSDQTIIGGQNGNIAYAAFVDITTNAAGSPVLNLPTAAGSHIGSSDNFIPGNGVAINEFGQAIVGGSNGTSAYAAFVDISTNTAGPQILNLPTAAGSQIYGVAINDFGQGLIGGSTGTQAYAAFVDPRTNTASNPILNLPTAPGSFIYSVAFMSAPFRLPTKGLHRNNLAFANYINQYAPQDSFYFIPALLNGTYKQALEIAAPTRNALSLFIADNNVFVLNQAFSLQMRHQRHFRKRTLAPRHEQMAWNEVGEDDSVVFDDSEWENSLFASNDDELYFARSDEDEFSEDALLAEIDPSADNPSLYAWSSSERPFSLWFEAIGFLASQKAQHQTVGFDPYAGGFILGLDHWANDHWRAGGGLAYTLTYIRERRHAGHSHINQEYLFAYTSWSSQHFYFDGALWGGAFQIDQRRNMNLNGWEFHATSHPKGWQLSPHIESGYEYAVPTNWLSRSTQYSGYLISPFAMFDWVNAWQNRYKEKGNGPFNAGQKSHYSSMLRSEIGLRLYEILAFSSWKAIFEEGVSYVNKTPFDVGKMNTFLVGSPGSFTVETMSNSQNLAAVELSTQFEPVNEAYPYGSLTYYGEYNTSFISHQLQLEIAWDF